MTFTKLSSTHAILKIFVTGGAGFYVSADGGSRWERWTSLIGLRMSIRTVSF